MAQLVHAAPALRPRVRPPLKRHTRLGKYRILRRLNTGGFASVFAARDEVLGMDVALKLPRTPDPSLVRELRREVHLACRLVHPHVVRLWNADEIDGHFLIVYELGIETLDDRLRRQLSVPVALRYAEELLAALRHAHECSVMHLDVKPENVILFPDGSVRLGDFGISQVSAATQAEIFSAAGTIGYMAPEQAYGRPSFTSDVFSAGLILYRMLSGVLPTWPFRWPFAGRDRFLTRAGPDLLQVVRRATEFDPEARYRDAGGLADSFARAAARLERSRRRRRERRTNGSTNGVRWREIRANEFRRRHAAKLGPFFDCYQCSGPVTEAMQCCPWCGVKDLSFRDVTAQPLYCPDCERGIAHDWRFCPWCYGAGFADPAPRRRRKQGAAAARCSVAGCRGPLPGHARYCPWCKSKVRRLWNIANLGQRCQHCRCEVAREFWNTCPWCCHRLRS